MYIVCAVLYAQYPFWNILYSIFYLITNQSQRMYGMGQQEEETWGNPTTEVNCHHVAIQAPLDTHPWLTTWWTLFESYLLFAVIDGPLVSHECQHGKMTNCHVVSSSCKHHHDYFFCCTYIQTVLICTQQGSFSGKSHPMLINMTRALNRGCQHIVGRDALTCWVGASQLFFQRSWKKNVAMFTQSCVVRRTCIISNKNCGEDDRHSARHGTKCWHKM